MIDIDRLHNTLATVPAWAESQAVTASQRLAVAMAEAERAAAERRAIAEIVALVTPPMRTDRAARRERERMARRGVMPLAGGRR